MSPGWASSSISAGATRSSRRLVEYIRIPNKSPSFDPDWAAHGYMDEAVALFERWARAKLAVAAGRHARGRAAARAHPGDPDRRPRRGRATPCCSTAISTSSRRWSAGPKGYGPWIPRLEGDKLYGRGGADDGYAMFGALSALLALRDQGVPHARCVVADRGVRGIRQLRPALLRRSPRRNASAARRWWSVSIPAAAITTSCG